MSFLSPQSIDALADIISGGKWDPDAKPIGIYRSGPEIEKFMRACNVDLQIGSNSRVPTLVDRLIELNKERDARQTLIKIIEAATNPRDFNQYPDRHSVVLEYLNEVLKFDGLAVEQQGTRMRVVDADKHAPVLADLAELSENIDFDTVNRDLERARESIEDDPEDAITAACSVVESVCRSILIELGEALPKKKDVSSLYKAVSKPLGLSAGRHEIDDDVRGILSGMTTLVAGIGALRTHAGDAHGRERGHRRVDARIARLSVNSASTIAHFLIETWQKKHPTRSLLKAME